jgi:quinoprotein glucose dehydrogenase
MSGDDELGYVYLPLETPTGDYYGGTRPGNNLFAESLVCLDARTGKRVWHFQAVHHGIWDYDFPAPPVLGDIVVNGRRIKALAQPTKQAFLYVFDRATGQPVWPIEERPGRRVTCRAKSTPTQPFPTAAASSSRSRSTISWTSRPSWKEAIEIVSKLKYSPPSPLRRARDADRKAGDPRASSSAGELAGGRIRSRDRHMYTIGRAGDVVQSEIGTS